MTEEERQEIRKLYYNRAKEEIKSGNLEIAYRALANVRVLSPKDGDGSGD